MHLILLGPPGAGKGTQGALVAKRLGVTKIATGDILRDAVKDGSELGRKAKRIMDAGELVSDDVILGLVEHALDSEAARDGAVFDGFPRNVAQAEDLDRVLGDRDRTLDAVVALDVPADAIVERMSGRRTDPETGQVYHIEHNPPPEGIAGRVIQRPDDREETIRHRLDVYERSTEPLIRHYEESGVPVHRLAGDRSIDEVQGDILRVLGR
jgi:adenylate kinase